MDARLAVSITTGKPMDARKPSTITVRVEDAASGTVLALFEVEAWEWWDLITGSHRTFDGFISPDLDHVGKVMLTSSVDVPRDVMDTALDGVPNGRDHLEQRKEAGEAAAELYAATLPDADAWPSLRGHQTNAGWKVTRHRWVDPADPEAVEGRRRITGPVDL